MEHFQLIAIAHLCACRIVARQRSFLCSHRDIACLIACVGRIHTLKRNENEKVDSFGLRRFCFFIFFRCENVLAANRISRATAIAVAMVNSTTLIAVHVIIILNVCAIGPCAFCMYGLWQRRGLHGTHFMKLERIIYVF